MKLPQSGLPPAMPEPIPHLADGAERLRVLESFEPDALEDDPELAAIVSFAARLCGVPVAQVSLVEDARQRFLAGIGLDVKETPRAVSFCDHAMRTPGIMEVTDATADPRFADNGLVTSAPGVRFYAGQPLVSEEGIPLGALCAIDMQTHPQGLNDFQREGMAVLAQAVMRRLNAQRADRRAAAEREARLRAVIDGLPQIAWSADAEGHFDYFNIRWEQITGAEPPKTAEDWRPFIHPDDAEETFAKWYECYGEGRPFECEYRLKRHDGSWCWALARGVPVIEGGETRWFGTVTDIDEVHRALESRDMLSRELAHRIKNIFAVVTGLVSLRVRRKPEHAPFADELVDTLRALSRAHDFVRPDGGETRESLLGLLSNIFAPYRDKDAEGRIVISGDDATVSARAATPLALIFHELATNSAKYGALSSEGGTILLTLKDSGDSIVLEWRETGGPQGDADAEPGFGTRLVDMSVTSQLQGSWERSFEPGGMVARITLPHSAIAV